MKTVAGKATTQGVVVLSVAWMCATVGLPVDASAQDPNLALNRSVTHSSDCSCGRATAAVDGDLATYPSNPDKSVRYTVRFVTEQ